MQTLWILLLWLSMFEFGLVPMIAVLGVLFALVLWFDPIGKRR